MLLLISALFFSVHVYSQSDTSLYLVDYGFGLNLWPQLPPNTDPSPLIAPLSSILQTVQAKSIDGKAFSNLLQVLKTSSLDALTPSSNYSTNDVSQLITARSKFLTTDQLCQTDTTNLDNASSFFTDKPQLVIASNVDWDKWNAYYARCALIVQKDSTKIDDVRKFLAVWLENGGDVPSTDLFNGGDDNSGMTITTTSTSTSIQTLATGSSEPPGMKDLLQKMKKVGSGNDASTSNLTFIYVFAALSLVIQLVF